ncbi:PREDICTED: uncharacterized protein LOC107116148 [Gekko japonicus]|uniref:Placenta-expressed transcript 1 protein n=1 Tax=Gekko japonicus TaxID=146911 RepID=A0ABM1KIH1_GEKJA|nr:PREDICTED: uncharacterized protein LOC107116148 [Gekko japonicus]
MANPRCTLQLLFLGLLVSPAFLLEHPCEVVKNTIPRGSFRLDVSPQTFRPQEIYTVTISGIDNGTSVILQALADGRSGGLWEAETEAVSCSGTEYLVKKNVSGNGTRTRWTSPSNANETAVNIRAFVTFANGTTLMQAHTLTRALTTGVMTPMPSRATHTASGTRLNTTVATHNWASTHQEHQVTQSSAVTSQTRSVLLAAVQFLPVFLGFKLLS